MTQMKIENALMDQCIRAALAMKSWLETREHFLPVVEDPLLADIEIFYTNPQLYISASGNAEQLETLFRRLAVHGFHLPRSAKRPEANKPDWSGHFYKQIEDSLEGLPVSFSIYVAFTSTFCRKEQVGTELKEVPVYKIICGEVEVGDPVPEILDEIPF